MFEWIFSTDSWLTLLILTSLEIILGIDNIIFLALLVNKLPPKHRNKGRILGLAFAMITRIALLFSLFWVIKLVFPLFSFYVGALENLSKQALDSAVFTSSYFSFFQGGIADLNGYWGEISGRDLVLFFGGLFLIFKSFKEIKEELFTTVHKNNTLHSHTSSNFWIVVAEIGIMDIIFSLDSVITAVGIADNIEIMIIAVIIAVLVMLVASKPVSDFIEKYPNIKILALVFLIMIGFILVCESFEIHFNKAYIYVAMFFALLIECLKMIRERKK
ncbi:TerC family protein [Campylobacter sp. MIT 21-1685]|uniref:TerC family protein n=1 Tax=unclassified Campylobacter TaxID=2593542 RepID=UPI00224AA4BB|nr:MULTISPECIES: TerC family protein [unclassified Campylobacter]MCX2683547.1 TerC family protein [Campylobacter sp. MIT 21-1684]MCX2751858.1 TerC family protein [Campylobacter sp. MIT 21-1682]MCX2808031.1 TerC family protein [Campylobacter sp. MIT 21-1685]